MNMADPVTTHRRQVNPLQALALLITFILLAGVGGLLTAGLLLPLAAGTGAMTSGTTKIFDELPDELEPGPLSQQSILLDRDGKKITSFYAENRIVVPLEDISVHMQNAAIAIEDKRFFGHGGVDVEGMARALVMNVVTESTQGASTLTQQYVKNVLIEQAVRDDDRIALNEAREESYERKLREAKLAVAIEKKMSKFEILERYLNIAQFGSSVYGVESASRYYFNKSASELEPVEAALIAGTTKAPNTYDPTLGEENLKFATTRRNSVLDQMYQQGYLDKEEHAEARKTPVEDTLDVTPTKMSCEAAGGAGFFCDYVTKVILTDPVFGETRKERNDLLLRGGLVIHTTLDSSMQKAANEELRTTLPAKDPTGFADAMVSVVPGSGEIRVMAQNRKFVANADRAGVGETSVNYGADQAHGGSSGFPTGSTYKVFVLAEWLRSGRSLSETVNASKRTWHPQDWTASCVDLRGSGDWSPGNVDTNLSGQISVLRATAFSVNTAYASMLSQLDLCDVADTADLVGLRFAMTKQAGKPEIRPSMVLGPQTSSPLSMASAYATFAADGKYCSPIAITKITGADGEELDLPESNCRTVLDSATAGGVTHALQEVLKNGGATSSALAGNRPAAGKTGTSQDNQHTWFIGYTPQLSTAVWLGHPDRNVNMQHMTINGRYHNYVYGSTLAGPTWKRFMDRALDGEEPKGFPKVDNTTLHGENIPIPGGLWGRTVSEVEKQLEEAGFRPTVRSGQIHATAPAGRVAYVSPSSTARRGSQVTIYVSNGTPEPAQEDNDDDDDNDDNGNGRDRGRSSRSND